MIEAPHGRAMAGLVRAIDRFLGCLLGGAVGDALGAPLEFLRRDEIVRRFGPHGSARYASIDDGAARITDDTRMTPFPADGLLRAWCCDGRIDATGSADAIATAYLRWLVTQHDQPQPAVQLLVGEPGWLATHHAPHRRCATRRRSSRGSSHARMREIRTGWPRCTSPTRCW